MKVLIPQQQQDFPENFYYNGNRNLKRAGVKQPMTVQEVDIYKKCMFDHEYFLSNYCYITNLDEGLVLFEPYDYQREIWNNLRENRFNIILASRQCGKSISICGYLLWHLLFHPDQLIALLANKAMVAGEMLGRIQTIFEHIPFFLQPGCVSYNKSSIVLATNAKIIAGSTSATTIRGFSASVLYLDEFGFAQQADDFFKSAFPTIASSKKSKVIITSTASSIGDKFHDIWINSNLGSNEFVPKEVGWQEVPGRDEKWKKQMIDIVGYAAFLQEYDNKFIGVGYTLIDYEKMMSLKASEPIMLKENNKVRIYENPEPEHQYVVCVDVSEGVGGDYSTFTIIDITSVPFQQVAVFRDNLTSQFVLPDICVKWAKVYNNAILVIETNSQGMSVANICRHDLEYEHLFVSDPVKEDGLGIKMTLKSKNMGCVSIKDIIENNKIVLQDKDTISEITTFQNQGSNTYKAIPGCHDDLMMNLVIFGYFIRTIFFTDISKHNIRSNLIYDDQFKEIKEEILPFGFIDDGSSLARNIPDNEETDHGLINIYDDDLNDYDIDKSWL